MPASAPDAAIESVTLRRPGMTSSMRMMTMQVARRIARLNQALVSAWAFDEGKATLVKPNRSFSSGKRDPHEDIASTPGTFDW